MPVYVQGYKPKNSFKVFVTYEEALKEEEEIGEELERQYWYWIEKYPEDKNRYNDLD